MKQDKIFESNPDLKEVHMTSDGEAFYKENDAKNHAKTLKDKTVELVVNPSQIDVIAEEVDFDDPEDLEQLKVDEGMGQNLEGIKALADGSENILKDGIGHTVLTNLPELTLEETKKALEKPSKIETTKEETPKVEAPKVETPKEETPKKGK